MAFISIWKIDYIDDILIVPVSIVGIYFAYSQYKSNLKEKIFYEKLKIIENSKENCLYYEHSTNVDYKYGRKAIIERYKDILTYSGTVGIVSCFDTLDILRSWLGNNFLCYSQ